MQLNCKQCNEEISAEDNICQHCGFVLHSTEPTEAEEPSVPAQEPQQAQDEQPQEEQVTQAGFKSKIAKNKLFVIIGILVIIAIAASLGIYAGVQARNRANERLMNEYVDTMHAASAAMLLSGVEAEEQVNLTALVWNNAIRRVRSPATDEFTRRPLATDRNFFVDDFNIALGRLSAHEDTVAARTRIRESQTLVRDLVRDLQNPPEGLERAHDALVDLYQSYLVLTDLALNPQGSLQTFSSNRTAAISDFLNAHRMLQTIIPDRAE